MRTMAQFGIRDADSALSDVTETMEPRSGIASLRNGNGSVIASSLRNAEVAPQIIEEKDMEKHDMQAQDSFIPLPTGISEMPTQNYNDSFMDSPSGNGASVKSDDTPTDTRKNHFELPSDDFDPEKHNFIDGAGGEELNIPGFAVSDPLDAPPPPVGPKPGDMNSLPTVERRDGDLWSLPSQQRQGGGLRVQNVGSDDEDDGWKKDAVMHMNLASR
jgi:hypothetical protein